MDSMIGTKLSQDPDLSTHSSIRSTEIELPHLSKNPNADVEQISPILAERSSPKPNAKQLAGEYPVLQKRSPSSLHHLQKHLMEKKVEMEKRAISISMPTKSKGEIKSSEPNRKKLNRFESLPVGPSESLNAQKSQELQESQSSKPTHRRAVTFDEHTAASRLSLDLGDLGNSREQYLGTRPASISLSRSLSRFASPTASLSTGQTTRQNIIVSGAVIALTERVEEMERRMSLQIKERYDKLERMLSHVVSALGEENQPKRGEGF